MSTEREQVEAVRRCECTCLPLPEGYAENCPVHGEDAPCTCGHPVHRHEETRIGAGPFRYEDWCQDCSCIDLEYAREKASTHA